MRISFIGCPCSGKTTTAAMTFASMKEIGINCEFIAEQARMYIAERRKILGLKPEQKLILEDIDQLDIMQAQLYIEETFDSVCDKGTLIITDSSPFNSILYMTNNAREIAINNKYIERAIFGADLVFYCPPAITTGTLDANRIHDEQQSLKIDESIPVILRTIAPAVWKNIIWLEGDPKTRLSQVTAAIMLRRMT
jgi:thymidylate kinase